MGRITFANDDDNIRPRVIQRWFTKGNRMKKLVLLQRKAQTLLDRRLHFAAQRATLMKKIHANMMTSFLNISKAKNVKTQLVSMRNIYINKPIEKKYPAQAIQDFRHREENAGGNYESEVDDVEFQRHEVKSEEDDVDSEEEDVKSEEEDVESEQDDVESEEEDVESEEDVKSEEEDVESEKEDVESEQDDVESEEEVVKSEEEDVRSEKDDVESEEEDVGDVGDDEESEGDDVINDVESIENDIEGEDDDVESKGDGIESEGDVLASEAYDAQSERGDVKRKEKYVVKSRGKCPRFKVITMNVNGPYDEYGAVAKRRRRTIQRLILKYKPTILLLQEFKWKHIKGRLWNTCPIPDHYHYRGHGEASMIYDGRFVIIKDLGTIMRRVLEDLQLKIVFPYAFNPLPRMCTKLVRARFKPSISFICISIHGIYKEKDKQNYFKNLLEYFRNIHMKMELPILVGGDFNVAVKYIQNFVSKPFKLYKYKASERRSKKGIIDFFITTDELHLSSNRFIDLETLDHKSHLNGIFDHDPIYARLSKDE